MTKWIRKRSFWPVLCALGCLFVLAVVAPQAWQRFRAKKSLRAELPSAVEQNKIPRIVPNEAIVTLEPEPQTELPEFIAPEIDAESQIAQAAQELIVENQIQKRTTVINPTEVIVELPSSRKSVPPAPELTSVAVPAFDFDVLLQMRDALVAMVDRLPKVAASREAAATELKITKPQVPVEDPLQKKPLRVQSESDRLAMLDRQPQVDFRRNEPSLAPTPPPGDSFEIPRPEPTVSESLEITEQAVPDLAPVDPLFAAVKPIPLPPIEEPKSEESISEPTPPREPLLRFRPEVLFEQLDQMALHQVTESWASEVRRELLKLSDNPSTTPSDTTTVIKNLRTYAVQGRKLADAMEFSNRRHLWFQTIQSLERRLAVWSALLDPEIDKKNSIQSTASIPLLLSALQAVQEVLDGESHGQDWREYLMLDRVAEATSEGHGYDQPGRSKLAQDVLAKMNSPKLSFEQKAFVRTDPLQKLQLALQPWAATSVNLDRLAGLIELYEVKREQRFGLAIAQVQRQLQWSNAAELQALAEHLDRHYRGSNMRLAITDDLMNQMLPKQKPIVSPVREEIAGANVRGKARTTTDLRIQLIPDSEAWKFDFEAFGKVYSTTRSETWPARVRNAAKMQYQAHKIITIDQQGLQVTPAKAKAKGRHELLGVDSELDGVPLLGFMLRDIARTKNQKSRPRAISQVKQKVARQARQRMDQEADPKLEALEQQFRNGVLGPIEKLALIAEPRSMFTTEDRAVMQLRLANEGQLAAHTPRPLAPADSAASMQLHETVLNNALAGLKLDGQRMKVVDLYEYFNNKFGRLKTEPPAELSRRAVIQFAKRDAVLVNCDDDQVKLVLNIREVAHGRDKIRNFQVHAFFQPVLEGLDVRLVRDGTLQFSGRRLKTGARVVLHSVFGKLMNKDTEILLLPEKVKADPRLQGLMVTQLVIDDGWIGLALGPAYPETHSLADDRSPCNNNDALTTSNINPSINHTFCVTLL